MQATNQKKQQIESPKNGDTAFTQLLDEYDIPRPKRGDILQGEILRKANDALLIDVGAKRDAIVPYSEISELDKSFLDNLSRGDEVPLYVMRTPVGDEQLLVSLKRGLHKLDWQRAEKIQAEDETVELEIINHNKGGLVVKFGLIQGFVPNTHIPEICNNHNSPESQQYKVSQIGKKRPLKIIEVNPKENRFVLSATAAQSEQLHTRLEALNVGDVVKGVVVNLKKYGAFVDIGVGLAGLLHISNISWRQIKHPSEKLTVGDEIDVMIEKVDLKNQRVSLTRKQLLPNPWDQFASKYAVDDLVEGRVTALVNYGAFVEVPYEIEGLLHQNEMAISQGGTPADVLQKGDKVLMRIIKIDPKQKRISLSMRRVSTTEEIEWIATQEYATV